MSLNPQIVQDLELENIHNHVPLKTTWGHACFTNQLKSPVADPNIIKLNQKQILLFKKFPDLRQSICMELDNIDQEAIQSLTSNNDPIVVESLSQIFWKKDAFGSFFNTVPFVLNGLITWKTIVLPGVAILMPLIALIVPFLVLNMTSSISTSDYLVHVKHVLLQQISIPSFLRSKGTDDRIGFLFESLFIGLTLATFISSLWNQIQSALHLRSIWNNVQIQGRAILKMVSVSRNMLEQLKTLDMKYQRVLRSIIHRGEELHEKCKMLPNDELVAFGSIWNDITLIEELSEWIGRVDALAAIASLDNICIPRISAKVELNLREVSHPELQTCIKNSFSAGGTTSTHAILTGPNRGGKTTFCRALGLAIITAQTWGFAWARRMTWSPFSTIYTALETNGVLGNMSKFESEIDFAKTVLGTQGSCFVMMDEIFHSTNATDGVAASTVFLKQLYDRKDIISLISTHYKELATLFGKSSATVVQMVAHEKPGGKLEYTYTMAPGISGTSSVMEILAERGLLAVKETN